jgi:hypothetical protein
MNDLLDAKFTDDVLFYLDKNSEKAKYEHQLRELVKNSIESIQERFASGDNSPGLIDVGKVDEKLSDGTTVSKLCVSDNGLGMTEQIVYNNMFTFMESGKQQGIQANFGLGAKLSTYPFNKNIGVRYITRHADSGGLFQFHLMKMGDRYGAKIYDNGSPFLPLRGNKIGSDKIFYYHGTRVVLLGNDIHQDTTIHPEDPNNKMWQIQYLNRRFLRFPDNINVSFSKGRSKKSIPVYGALHYLMNDLAKENDIIVKKHGLKNVTGVVILPDGTKIIWGISGTKKISKHEKKNRHWVDEYTRRGFVAVNHIDEIYNLYSSTSTDGIDLYMDAKINNNFSNIWILIVPNEDDVSVEIDRDGLIYKRKRVDKRVVRGWMAQFGEQLPEELKKLSENENIIEGLIRDREKRLRDLAKKIHDMIKKKKIKLDPNGKITVKESEEGEEEKKDRKKREKNSGSNGGGGGDKVTSLFDETSAGSRRGNKVDGGKPRNTIIRWTFNSDMNKKLIGQYNETNNELLINGNNTVLKILKDQFPKIPEKTLEAGIRFSVEKFFTGAFAAAKCSEMSTIWRYKYDTIFSPDALTTQIYGAIPYLIEDVEKIVKGNRRA